MTDTILSQESPAHPFFRRSVTVPRPYQISDAAFLRHKKRAMLTSRPGIGKTLPAILAAQTPCLVLCPTYLVGQWRDVLRHERPDCRTVVMDGERARRVKILETAVATGTDYVVTNIEYMRTGQIPLRYFRTLIVDESHYCRGRTAMQSKAIKAFARSVEYVFLLTGTPIQREADDLWMQLSIIDPRGFSSYWKFVEAYCNTLTTAWSTQVTGVKHAAQLKELLSHYAVGHTYAEVGLFLPDLLEQTIRVTPTAAFSKRYAALKDTYRDTEKDITFESATGILVALRRATVCKEKIDALRNLVQDTNGDGAVIFVWYRSTAEALQAELGFPIIDGSTPPDQRAAIARSERYVIATLASLSEGVDLSAKKLCIFMEQDFLPGRLDQALSRLRRWTDKTEPVRVYTLLMAGTIDESIDRMVTRRESDIVRVVRSELSQIK